MAYADGRKGRRRSRGALRSLVPLLLVFVGQLPAETLVVGDDENYPPYAFRDENGDPVGYNVDIIRAIGKAMRTEIDIRTGPWAGIRSDLEAGRIDAIAGMFYSEERDEEVDFTMPFTVVHHSAFVRKDGPEIRDVEDLRGKRLLFERGDIMHDYALARELTDEMLLFGSQEEVLRALAEGRGEVALLGKLTGLHFMEKLGLENIEPRGPLLRPSAYCIAVREGDGELLALFEQGLNILEQTGRQRALREKWFGVLEPPGISKDELQRWMLLVLVPLFLGILVVLLWIRQLRVMVARRTRELRESEELQRISLQSIGDGLITTGEEGRVRMMNPVAERLTGWSSDEAVGQSLEAVFRIEDARTGQREESPFHRILRENGTVGLTNQTVLLSADGCRHHIADTGAPIRDQRGAVHGVVVVFRDITETHEMQREMVARERLFHGVFDQTVVGMAIINEAGTITEINEAASKMVGYSCEELRGREFIGFVHPEERPASLEALQRMQQGEEGRVLRERRFLHAQGHIRHALLSVNPVFQADGRFTYAIAHIQDVSELKFARKAMEKQEALFEAAMDNSSAGIIIAEAPGGDIQYINGAARRIHGLTDPEGTEELKRLSPVERAMIRDRSGNPVRREDLPLMAAMRTGQSVRGEFVIVRPDGEERDITAQAAPIRNEASEITGSIVVFQDITDRLHEQRQLAKINRILYTIREINFLITRGLEKENLLRQVVDKLVASHNYRHAWIALEEGNGTITEFVHAPADENLVRLAHAVKSGKRPLCIEKAAECEDVVVMEEAAGCCGEPALHDATGGCRAFCMALRHRGRIHGYLSVALSPERVEDPEERRLLKDLGEDIGLALYGAEAEQQREAIMRELREAKESAENANKAKDDFLAVMSHEMRTPLNPIMGFAQLLRETHTEEPERGYLDHIIEGAQRELKLVENILNYTRLERMDFQPSVAEFRVLEVCEEAIAPFQMEEKPFTVSLRNGGESRAPVEEDLTVLGHRDMIHQLLDNLLGNACKYTREGYVRLCVSRESKGEDQLDLLFAVEDTGIGIEPEMQDRLFQPFTQVDSSLTRNYEGAGLGLAICRKLVDLAEGEIGIESEPGQGSRFWFRIPVRKVVERSPSEKKENESLLFSERIRCLVVEDRSDNAAILAAFIRSFGGEAVVADSGERALRIADEQAFHGILMDLAMPDMDGLTVTNRLRENSVHNATTPVIAVTADVREGIRKQCESSGMQDYLPKPIRRKDLFAVLKRLCENSPG